MGNLCAIEKNIPPRSRILKEELKDRLDNGLSGGRAKNDIVKEGITFTKQEKPRTSSHLGPAELSTAWNRELKKERSRLLHSLLVLSCS